MTARPPTPQLVQGKDFGEPLYVLTRPEVRNGEVLSAPRAFDTRDGVVAGGAGDIGVFGYGGEQWPVKRDVFLGSYRILGRVGSYIVAQRLVHVRLAWTVQCDDAIFDYGVGRGRVPAPRDGWVYQSDDPDFGYIHPDVKLQGHDEVGPQAEVSGRPWTQYVERAGTALILLPPVLALLALLAFAAQIGLGWSEVAWALIAIETVLLLAGAALVWKMHRDRWVLKAVVDSGQNLCRRFQCAVELLAEPASQRFPAMSLWRAAQQQMLPEGALKPEIRTSDPAREGEVKAEIGATLASLKEQVQHAHRLERVASITTLCAFVAIIVGNLVLLGGVHAPAIEVVAIWLPSVIGAGHLFNFRRRTVDRIGAMNEFTAQLKFIQTRLFQDSPPLQPGSQDGTWRVANLRLLCKVVAQHSQRELGFALFDEPQLPL
jgi:hypothetical protein